ncbi:hypothetical protein L1887_48014 [Cichorium endivia]|nr:hypothetical protein L1887_48014 [Cichorium endivia]
MTTSTLLAVSDLLEALQEVEGEFLAQDESFGATASKLARMPEEIRRRKEQGLLDQVAVDELHHIVQRIKIVTHARLGIEEVFTHLRSEVKEEAIRIREQESEASFPIKPLDLSESLSSYHMRKHFLEHLDNPYPSQKDKESLVEATNASSAQRKKSEERGNDLQLNQLTLCVDDVLRDNLGRLTESDKKEFEDDWTSMISWLKYGVKEKVGDWVYDIVANSKKPLKAGQPRTVTTAANRSPVRKTAAPSRPKRATRRISKTPSVDSDISSEHESTPELSMCSTADTSFSSFGSNISLLQYDPFQASHEALLSPTLKAAATRKVKALPKRSQKADSAAQQTCFRTCGKRPSSHQPPCSAHARKRTDQQRSDTAVPAIRCARTRADAYHPTGVARQQQPFCRLWLSPHCTFFSPLCSGNSSLSVLVHHNEIVRERLSRRAHFRSCTSCSGKRTKGTTMLGPLRLRHFPLFLDLVRLHGFASVSGLRAELRNERSGFVLVPFVLTPQSAHHRIRRWTQASYASVNEVRRNKG